MYIYIYIYTYIYIYKHLKCLEFRNAPQYQQCVVCIVVNPSFQRFASLRRRFPWSFSPMRGNMISHSYLVVHHT